MIAATKEIRSLAQLYVRHYHGHLRQVVGCLIGSLVRSLLAVPIALLARQAIDKGFSAGSSRSLALTASSMVAIYLLSSVLSVVVQHASTAANSEATATLRKQLAARLHDLPRSFITAISSSMVFFSCK